MKSEFNVARALGSVFAGRILAGYSLIMTIYSLVILLIILLLAYFFSGWWLLLLLIHLPVVLMLLIIRLVLAFIIRRLNPKKLTNQQKLVLNNYADTVQHLIESRALGWPLLVLLSVKDLLFYRQLRTLKKIITSTASLYQEFNQLKVSLETTASND